MNVKKPKRGYLDLADPKKRIEFQYNPETIKDTKSVNWEASEVPGRAQPNLQFKNGSPRLIEFILLLDVFKRSDSNRAPEAIEERIKLIRSAIYPRKGSGSAKRAPTKVLFTLGRLVVWGVIKKADVEYVTWDSDLNLMRASIEIEIEEVPLKAGITADDIRGNAMFVSSASKPVAMIRAKSQPQRK